VNLDKTITSPQHSNTPTLHYSITPLLRGSAAPWLRGSAAPPLRGLLRQQLQHLHATIAVTPFVVVPADQFHELAAVRHR
jgi:hypothetical protein